MKGAAKVERAGEHMAMAEKIVLYLNENPGEHALKDLAFQFGAEIASTADNRYNYVSSLLRALAFRGQVTKVGRGVYCSKTKAHIVIKKKK